MYSAAFCGSLRGKMRITNCADGTNGMGGVVSWRTLYNRRAVRRVLSTASKLGYPLLFAVNHIAIRVIRGRTLLGREGVLLKARLSL